MEVKEGQWKRRLAEMPSRDHGECGQHKKRSRYFRCVHTTNTPELVLHHSAVILNKRGSSEGPQEAKMTPRPGYTNTFLQILQVHKSSTEYRMANRICGGSK